MWRSKNRNDVARDIEEGKRSGRYTNCTQLVLAGERTFQTYCKQRALQYPENPYPAGVVGIPLLKEPHCPEDCHFFEDRAKAEEERKAAEQRAAEDRARVEREKETAEKRARRRARFLWPITVVAHQERMSGLVKYFRENVGGNAIWDVIKWLVVAAVSGGGLTYYRQAIGEHLLGSWPRWVAWLFGFAGLLLGLIVPLIRHRRSGPAEEWLPADLTFAEPFYYAQGDSTPFCPRCWQASKRRMHLDEDWDRTRWECPDCHYVKVLKQRLPARQ